MSVRGVSGDPKDVVLDFRRCDQSAWVVMDSRVRLRGMTVRGGAGSVFQNVEMEMMDVVFEWSVVECDGMHVVRMLESEVWMQRVVMRRNVYGCGLDGDAGGVIGMIGSRVVMDEVVVWGNEAWGGLGGGVFARESDVRLDGVWIGENVVETLGGNCYGAGVYSGMLIMNTMHE